VTYDVVISVDNSHLKLKPGMTANVTIIVDTRRDVLRVPNAALRFWPDGVPRKNSGAGPTVWVLKNGDPRRLDIETGIDDFSVTEVRGSALEQGQEVITGYAKKKS
jgi:HlyD family secretion protein